MSRAGFVTEALHSARSALSVDEIGVAVSTTSLTSIWGLVESSGFLVCAVDDEQFDLGEGPVPAALRYGSVHVARDLMSEGTVDFHATFLARAASQIGVGSIIAIGMQLPTDHPAALVLVCRGLGHRVDIPAAEAHAKSVALAIARDIDRRLIRGSVGDHWIDRFIEGRETDRPPTHDSLNRRLRVMVAVDLIVASAHCGRHDAVARLRGFAFRNGSPLTDVAELVTAERVTVDELLA